MHSTLAPRIAAYTHDQVAKLIKLLKANPGAYRTRPEGYIWNMELVWLPLMSGSVSLDNEEEVGGVPTSGGGSDGCIAPRDQSGCEAQPDEGTVEVAAEPSVVTPANISQASTGVAEVGSSRRLSAADKGKKAVVEESKMESSDSDENE